MSATGNNDERELVCHACQRRGRHRLLGLAVREPRLDAPAFAPRGGPGENHVWWRPLRLHRWGDRAAENAAAGRWRDATYREGVSAGRAVLVEVADEPTERVELSCRACRRTVEVRQERLNERCAARGGPVAL